MNISFGICLSPNYNLRYVYNLIYSIINQKIPNFEIIMIGNMLPADLYNFQHYIDTGFIKYIPFDEDIKIGWITKKKNVITQNSKHEYVCISHDYYRYDKDWYFNLCVNPHKKDILIPKIVNEDTNTRGPDWMLNPFKLKTYLEKNLEDYTTLQNLFPTEEPMYVVGLPYDYMNAKKLQYISGGFIFCKKQILLDVPLNENYVWGQAEDVEWSERLLEKYSDQLSCIPECIVYIQKPKKWKVFELPKNVIKNVTKFYEKDYERLMYAE